MGPEGSVAFNTNSKRIFLSLKVNVEEMADPWREICASTIESFYRWFYFPSSRANGGPDLSLSLLGKYFGDAIWLDQTNAKQAIAPFLESIVTSAIFLVADQSSKHLKWYRVCAKDNKTGKITFAEHRYSGE